MRTSTRRKGVASGTRGKRVRDKLAGMRQSMLVSPGRVASYPSGDGSGFYNPDGCYTIVSVPVTRKLKKKKYARPWSRVAYRQMAPIMGYH